MCGIAGIIAPSASEQELVHQVQCVLESMRYRGPDALGVFSAPGIAAGNVRLAIQGIDPTGNQPVYNEDRTVAVLFNGEIYNFPQLRRELESAGHHFSTHTDTELLVHLYEDHGIRMADRLNGMFAFALIDRKSGHMLLGRDRTAQKPLFLQRKATGICFASELRALLYWVDSPRLRASAARDFLSLGYFLEPENLIEGVESLLPGTVVEFNPSGLQVASHRLPFPDWAASFASFRPGAEANLGEWLEEADAIFGDAVQRHTLSDVPVTVFLSGGVDSSLVAAFLAERGGVKTVHSGSFTDAHDYDEFSYGKSLADQLGLETRRVDLSRQALADAIPDFCATSSQPQGDYSGLPSFVLARETAKNFRVVLGGDGGDELFSGYPTYLLPELQRRFGIVPAAAIRAGAAFLRQFSNKDSYLPLHFKLELLAQAWKLPTARAHYAIKDFLPSALVRDVLNPTFFQGLLHPPPGHATFETLFGADDNRDVLRRLGMLDFSTFLGSCTIPKMERNCMLWSLENRLPFLDNNVLELAARTPPSLQRRGSSGKWCLRQLLEKKLGAPPQINPRKQGFGPPLARMLDAELKEWSLELLDRAHPAFRNGLTDLFAKHASRGWDLHRLIWNVCILKDWTLRNHVAIS